VYLGSQGGIQLFDRSVNIASTMKILSKLLAASLFISPAHAKSTFRPYRLDFQTLMDESAFSASYARQDFLDALTSVGLVSITGIPSSRFKKQDVLSWGFHECVASTGVGQEYRFPDGTTRRTVATHTIPGPGGARQVFQEDDSATSSKVCTIFSEASIEFRSVVADVTEAFASRLTSVLEGALSTPLMVTNDGSHQFQSFSDVVANGEHLEHFHSYQRTADSGLSETTDGTTIELHTDQGLFLVFAPGRLVDAYNGKSLQLSSGLHIQPADDDDEVVEVEFGENDDLVIMLGDGMNRVVNPKIKRNVAGATSLTLRATPHALYVPRQEENNARLWYGRMVLPPALAQSDVASMTHGDVRNKIIQAAAMDTLDSVETLSLGCSKAGVPARILNEVGSCQENYIYCWHTCMSVLEFNVSEEICASRNLRLECINPRDQIYVEGHGDYFPGCTNSTQNATDYPKLPTYPRNDSSCPEASWEEFSSGKGYNATYEIVESISKIHWNVLDGGKVEGKLDFNGLFGYLAFGFANETDYDLNGMFGGSVIMALPGGDYSPVTGLNLSLSPEVKEYHIGMETAFRHWFQPVKSLGRSAYSVNVTDCFVSLLFKVDSINGLPFNVSGTNSMIWAANHNDYFAGYHGNITRSRIVLDWSAGTGYLFSANQRESSATVPDSMAASGSVKQYKISIRALLSISLLVAFSFSF
jgi:hypothetical protein